MRTGRAGALAARVRRTVLCLVLAAASLGSASPTGDISASSSALEIDPVFTHLGRCSPVDPLASHIACGKTTVRLLSEEDWQIEVVMAGPMRRQSDGLEVTRTRHGDAMPLAPRGILDLRPCVVASGRGSSQRRNLEIDWREIGSALEEVLDPATPPGTYQTTLLARLLDRVGRPLTGPTRATIQFDVPGWVLLPDGVPSVELTVAPSGLGGQVLGSEMVSLLVAGNTAWRLRVARLGELFNEDGGAALQDPGAILAVFVPQAGLGPRVNAASPGYQPLGPDPVTVAWAVSPAPFQSPWEEIPIVVRIECSEPLPAGRYRTTVIFEVEAHEPLP